MRDEIIAGLRNGVARGQTLEQAAQSFVNAGYNPQEVRAAYQMLSSGASNTIATNAHSLPQGQEVQIQQNTQRAIGSNNVKPVQNQMKPQQAQQQMQPQNQPPMQQQGPAVPGAPSENMPEKKKGKKTGLLILMIIIAALIFLGAVGYLVYVLYFS
jgi:FtsZ-interacting cell division protein ZipA